MRIDGKPVLRIQDATRPVLALRSKLPDLCDERRILIVAAIDGHIVAPPSWESRETMRCLRLQMPSQMNDCAALLISSRCFNAGRNPLVVEVLDGMPASVGALLQAVVDNIGPDDRRFEDPAIGKMPA
jgi:hypothetical protein